MTETEYKAIRARIDRQSNDEISAVEVYEFLRDKPDRYSLYIDKENQRATTWTGERLGSVCFGREYRDNFGGVRVPIDVHAINGLRYHGTYCKSSGNCARIRQYKHQRKTSNE